jgi:hypothetical protein
MTDIKNTDVEWLLKTLHNKLSELYDMRRMLLKEMGHQ